MIRFRTAIVYLVLIAGLLGLLCSRVACRGSGEAFEGERSGRWRSVRAAHLEEHPVCAACGCDEDLHVHHVKPFRSYPELELDPANLITLCGYDRDGDGIGRNCHFYIGHDPDGPGPLGPNWRKSNPDVREDAENWAKGK